MWIVDDDAGPGVDFPDLAPAVAAAASGDFLLVKDGSYGSVVLDKSLTVVAEQGAAAVAGELQIHQLAAGEQLVVRGLRFRADGLPLSVSGSQGRVWLEACRFENTSAAGTGTGLRAAAVVEGSNSVVFLSTTLQGGTTAAAGVAVPEGQGTALRCTDTDLHLYDCVVQGGDGLDSADGGHGILLSGGSLFASGSTLAGGPGGASPCPGESVPGTPGGDGGSALVLAAGAPLAHTLACGLAGGSGGAGGAGTGCDPGQVGTAVAVQSGSHVTLGGFARFFAASSPVREGNDISLLFTGEPGDAVFLLIAGGLDAQFDLAFHGTQVVAAPFFVLPVGNLPPWGALSLSVPSSTLMPGVNAKRFLTQGAFLSPSFALYAGSGSAVVVLDDSL